MIKKKVALLFLFYLLMPIRSLYVYLVCEAVASIVNLMKLSIKQINKAIHIWKEYNSIYESYSSFYS